jgi:hypothetical protein
LPVFLCPVLADMTVVHADVRRPRCWNAHRKKKKKSAPQTGHRAESN